MSISVKILRQCDIDEVVEACRKGNWPKPRAIFEKYLYEQEVGERIIWVARQNEQFAGYITLKWQSKYNMFYENHIPEIMDLNVLPNARRCGIASQLLEIAEKEASTKSKIVGLGVGLYGGPDGGYGMAQRLYIKRGYVPDGKGVTYNYRYLAPGNGVLLDDDLILWFTKNLANNA